jgi:hypothetical protein
MKNGDTIACPRLDQPCTRAAALCRGTGYGVPIFRLVAQTNLILCSSLLFEKNKI